MISDEDQIMMETLYWWGIPTLFRCKNDPDPKNCDIALVGVPHSTGNGTTERDQHLGPRAVRNISAMLKRSHLKYGFDLSNKDGSIHLHSRELNFTHPVKKEDIHIIAPPPSDPIWDAVMK